MFSNIHRQKFDNVKKYQKGDQGIFWRRRRIAAEKIGKPPLAIVPSPSLAPLLAYTSSKPYKKQRMTESPGSSSLAATLVRQQPIWFRVVP